MGQPSRKFIARAPRYTLRPSDNRFLRFAAQDTVGKSYTTHFVDISTTGLAFVTDRESAPDIYEIIKVEIPLEAGQSIAWWAKVVRVEEYTPHKWYMRPTDFVSEDHVMVAISFQELPAGHRQQIRLSLEKKFEEVRKDKIRRNMSNTLVFFASQFWQLCIYAICVAATVWFLWYLSRPSENYDAQRGAPWGERYPWLNLFPGDSKSPEN